MIDLHRFLRNGLRGGLTAALVAMIATPVAAQRLSGEDLIDALQQGGHVIVMRHAPASLDAARSGGGGGGGGFGGGGRGGFGGGGGAPPEPTEEALEPSSIEILTGARHTFWHFRLPVGAVYTAPARKTRQQADQLPFAEITEVDELDADAAGSGWLAGALAQMPDTGTNTLIVTHAENISADLGLSAAPGETLIVRPGNDPTVIGRVGLREWSVLAMELAN